MPQETLVVQLAPAAQSALERALTGVDLESRSVPHARFSVSEHHLATVLPIAPWEAALGARASLRTLDGSEVLLSVPPGSSSGKRLRMRGMGLPRSGSERGDLIVELRVVVPENPTDAERAAFQELARVSKFDPRNT